MITFALNQINQPIMENSYALEIQVKAGRPVRVIRYCQESMEVEKFHAKKFLEYLKEVNNNVIVTSLDKGVKYIQEIYIDATVYKRTEKDTYKSKYQILMEMESEDDGDVLNGENHFLDIFQREYVVKIQDTILKVSVEDIISEIESTKFFETRFIADIYYKN